MCSDKCGQPLFLMYKTALDDDDDGGDGGDGDGGSARGPLRESITGDEPQHRTKREEHEAKLMYNCGFLTFSFLKLIV